MPRLVGIRLKVAGKEITNSSEFSGEMKKWFGKAHYHLGKVGGSLHRIYETEITPMMIDHIHELFWREESPEGEAWDDLKESTVERKERSGYEYIQHPGILQATRNLFNSIDAVFVGKWTLSFGTDVPYGIYHMTGFSVKGVSVAPRPFLGFSSEMEVQIINTLQDIVNNIAININRSKL